MPVSASTDTIALLPNAELDLVDGPDTSSSFERPGSVRASITDSSPRRRQRPSKPPVGGGMASGCRRRRHQPFRVAFPGRALLIS